MTDAEKCLDTARCELRKLASSGSVQDLNTSSLGKLSFHESMVHEELRRRKRAVAELKAEVAAERRLASLRRLTGKAVSKRQPCSLRDADGWQVEDQSRWSDIVHEHFKKEIQI